MKGYSFCTYRFKSNKKQFHCGIYNILSNILVVIKIDWLNSMKSTFQNLSQRNAGAKDAPSLTNILAISTSCQGLCLQLQ